MATSIITGLTTPGTAATGRSTQGHIQYAVNQGAWWVFYLTSTNQLSAKYSTDGTTWTEPIGSPMTIATHGSEGRNFAFAYKSIAATDVLHASLNYGPSGTASSNHARYTLGTTWANTNASALVGSSGTGYGGGVSGSVTVLDSNNLPVDITEYDALANNWGDAPIHRGSNTDSGTSWTAGFAAQTLLFTGQATFATSSALFALASGNVLALCDSAPSSAGTFTQLEYSKWTSSWSAAAVVLASTVTPADTNAWGGCALSTTDIHVVALFNNINTFVHRRFNGTAWANGNTPNNLAYGTTSGIAVVSDGTSVWAFAADTSKNIQYSKWTSGGGWGAWTVLEAVRTNAPRYLSACMKSDNSAIQVIWTETNGSNFEVWTSQLSLSASPSFLFPQPFPSIPYAFLSY